MRHIKLFAVSALLLLLPAAMAALPPHFQRVAELSAVMNDSAVAEAFGIMRPIDAIEYVDVDLYRVTGGTCHMFVRLLGIAMPEGFVGARQFEVVPGDLVCG